MRRLTQFGASLAIILSLFVSVFAVCACAHHHETKEENSVSCHEMTGEMADAPNENGSQTQFSAAAPSDCNCFAKTSQPFVVSGVEKIKTQKILALPSATIEVRNSPETTPIAAANLQSNQSFYHPSFRRRRTPPRAPPV